MGERGNKREGLVEAILGIFRDAIGGARSALIDEGWFGRRAPAQDRGDPLGWGGDPERRSLSDTLPSFEEAWAPRQRDEPSAPAEPDLGMDR